MKNSFPFMVSRPAFMTVLEQVLCMVYLAQTNTLKELRERQTIIEKQQESIRNKTGMDIARADLSAMSDNTAAAVAWKEFPKDDYWLAFINQT